jgi:hypothetical protein
VGLNQMKLFLRSISCIVLASCAAVTPTDAPTDAPTTAPFSQANSSALSLEMVALTPAFPVVRDNAVLHQSGPVNFSAAFHFDYYGVAS